MYKKLIETFIQAVNKYNESGGKKNYGTPWFFTQSEIHLVEAIGDNSGKSITEIASILNITKGAVSQSVNKLIKRDMLKKHRVAMTEKTVALELTDNGLIAYRAHQLHHKKFEEKFRLELKNYDDREINRFIDLLKFFIES